MCNWLARCYDPRRSVSVDELIETYFDMLANGLVQKDGARRKQVNQRKLPEASWTAERSVPAQPSVRRRRASAR